MTARAAAQDQDPGETPATDFEAWLVHMGGGAKRLPDKAAAELLGVSRATVKAYRTGASPMPLVTALACSSLACGVPAWPPTLQVFPTGRRRRP